MQNEIGGARSSELPVRPPPVLRDHSPTPRAGQTCVDKFVLRENRSGGHGKVVCYTAAGRSDDRLAGAQCFQYDKRLRFICVACREHEDVDFIEKARFVRPENTSAIIEGVAEFPACGVYQ